MVVLIVLLVSWLVFRGLGFAGVHSMDTWRDSARYAMAALLVFAAVAHFGKMKVDFARMIPAYFPQPMAIVYITGVLEFAGACGLLLSRFQKPSGICLIALLCAMFIANLNAASKGITFLGKPPTPLWLRIPMQILFIVLLWWSTGI